MKDWQDNLVILFKLIILFGIFFGVMLLITKDVEAAVVYNDITVSAGTSDEFICSLEHSGENGLILVSVGIKANNYSKVISADYNGNTLTKLLHAQARDYIRTEIWYLVAPPEGNYELAVNISPSAECAVDAISVTGVSQTNPFYYSLSTMGDNVSTIPFKIMQEAGNSIMEIGHVYDDALINTTSGQTELFNIFCNDEIRAQGICELSTDDSTKQVENFLNKVSIWSLILINIKAAAE